MKDERIILKIAKLLKTKNFDIFVDNGLNTRAFINEQYNKRSE